MTAEPTRARAPAVPRIEISYRDRAGERHSHVVTSATLIGRGDDCGIRVSDPAVSRHHLALYSQDGHWWIKDLDSRNGTLVAGEPIQNLVLTGITTVQLGRNGVQLRIVPESVDAGTTPRARLADVSRRYLDDSSDHAAGEHTRMVRHVFREAKRRQRRIFVIILSAALVLLAVLGAVALLQYEQLQQTRTIAKETFYQMKELELHIANLEAGIAQDASAQLKAQIAESKRVLAGMRERYDDFVQQIEASRLVKLDSEDEIILHMARIFGETELELPADFVAEVKAYIRKWQATPRLARAIRRLQENNFAPIIFRELQAQDLPPQFLYLALQESGFRPDAVGPLTRYGHAKGMWQFIPATAQRYGLTPGPLQHLGRYDPDDDRHNVPKATRAAARYLKDIYRTDAQASGLLVMASYNWGEGNIIKRLRKMPENPRERNFWSLLRDHRIPNETYHYVFYIFSAAVIGENPQLFGFDFENPLLGLGPTQGPLTLAAGESSAQPKLER